MKRLHILTLVALWILLIVTVISEIAEKGNSLYYPVVLAWLGGLISATLTYAVYIHRNPNQE